MTGRTRTLSTFAPPVPEAAGWVRGRVFPADRPLLNLSQAAPVAPPPEPMRQAMAEVLLGDDSVHLYGPDLGLPALRAEIADRWAEGGGAIRPDQVAITSGCNQAFAAAIAALTGEGDEVLLPSPWYFNHKMWLDMSGVGAVALPVGADMLPDPGDAAARITPRTRAIALVSPNNPAGVEYPPALIHAFADLAQEHGIHLILDETYRDFRAASGPAHALFHRTDWPSHVIQLYSFSKAYRLTGHRVGAMVADAALLDEVEKFIDTVTICPNQIAQHAALFGLRHLGAWLAGERAEILARRAAMEAGFARLADRGWHLAGIGAYFAYARHPFDMGSDRLARELVDRASLLTLPATMFVPPGDVSGQRHLRLAFANLDQSGIATLFERLEALDL